MSEPEVKPIVKMQEDGSGASIVSYNVPEPTTYFGNKYFEIDLQDLVQSDERFAGVDWRTLFKDFANLPFQGRASAIALLQTLRQGGTLQTSVEQILNHGYNHKKIGSDLTPLDLISKFFYLPSKFEGLKKIERNIENELVGCSRLMQNQVIVAARENNLMINRAINIRDSVVLNYFQKLTCINSFDFISDKLLEGNFIAIYRKFSGQYDYKFIPIPEEITPRIFIIEKYKLSSFLGNYGAGRTVKTFSLLPGEKTKITVKTFKKTLVDNKQSSSILDSYTQESADEFEDTLNKEQTNKQAQQEKLSWHVEAEVSASWGWGSAKVSGGASGENASQREDMAKQVANSVKKHAQKASAKRDVQVNTSYERKEETGEETSIEREIENINVSRTLNFVFRQMNQEFLTLLHLVDATIGYTSGLPGSYLEDSISRLDGFFNTILQDPIANVAIKNGIIDHLCFVIDYKGDVVPFLERKTFNIPNPIDPARPLLADYIKVKSDMVSTYENVASNLKKEAPGIIVSAQLNVMRTDGIFVEALLGQGDGLDTYSHGLQDEAVREKELANNLKEKEIAKLGLANTVVESNETDKAKLFQQVYPCCPSYVLGCTCSQDKEQK
jgi:hypothetical protein